MPQNLSQVILISSPLQAVVVDALLSGDNGPPKDRTIVFVEDERFVDFFTDVACVAIADTRLAGRAQIAENLRRIEAHLAGQVTLWVSDILWPMNNALYTRLKSSGRLEVINFFDEGMVLYWQERLTRLNHARELLKFRVLGFKLGVQFSWPARMPFYGNARNGSVYALHPELLSNTALVKALDLDLDRVAGMAARLGNGEMPAPLAERAALVLSQPYYRVADEAEFASAIAGMAAHLRERGHERIYVKLHPSEGPDLFNRYYRELGFEIAFPGMKAPIEVALQTFPASSTLVSFNSSALLNARKFGFAGESLSYGLNWVAAQYPMHRNLFDQTSSLLQHAGVAIRLH